MNKQWIFVCGNPSDADALKSQGVAALAVPDLSCCGRYIEHLAGSHVAIMPGVVDGQKVAYATALEALAGTVEATAVVHPPGGKPDLQTAFIDGHTLDEVFEQLPDYESLKPPLETELAAPIEDEGYAPPPMDRLPNSIRDYCQCAARSVGCDVGLVLPSLLAALSALIGNARMAVIKGADWLAPAALWLVSVAVSGDRKTPAHNLGMAPVRKIQARHHREYRALKKKYDAAMKAHKAAARTNQKGGPSSPEPDPPTRMQLIVGDSTIEALVSVLAENPRGLILDRDELGALVRALDRYASRGGSEIHTWLMLFDGGPVTVNRKSTEQKFLYVPRGLVAIASNIQPDVLRKCATDELFETGFMARFLFTMPPRMKRDARTPPMSEAVRHRMEEVCEELYRLQPESGDEAEFEPKHVSLDTAAFERFAKFVEEHDTESRYLEPRLQAAWAKLEQYVVRFALLFHCVRAAEHVVDERPKHEAELRESGEAEDDEPMKALAASRMRTEAQGAAFVVRMAGAGAELARATMEESTRSFRQALNRETMGVEEIEDAIALVEWFKRETRRVYERMWEFPDTAQREDLIGLIRVNGGRLTVRELMKRRSRFRKEAKKAAAALQRLVDAGYARWEQYTDGSNQSRKGVVLVENTEERIGNEQG
jgi:hypothetical protein